MMALFIRLNGNKILIKLPPKKGISDIANMKTLCICDRNIYPAINYKMGHIVYGPPPKLGKRCS